MEKRKLIVVGGAGCRDASLSRKLIKVLEESGVEIVGEEAVCFLHARERVEIEPFQTLKLSDYPVRTPHGPLQKGKKGKIKKW